MFLERRQQAVSRILEKYGLSKRHACRLVSLPRGTQRYVSTVRADEDVLTQATIALALQYGLYGYRWITAQLQQIGWQVSQDRALRILRREGLKVPKKRKPWAWLWLNDGSARASACDLKRQSAPRGRPSLAVNFRTVL